MHGFMQFVKLKLSEVLHTQKTIFTGLGSPVYT
jgi:hypothetical protein